MTGKGNLYKKRKLFAFGLEKVIWVLTDAQLVEVGTAARTETFDWVHFKTTTKTY